MPIHIRVSHPDRMVVCVAHGTVTSDEIQDALREHWDSGAVHYRKLVDVAAANSSADIERLRAIVMLARAAPNASQRGPVAFVVDGKRGEMVRALATMTEDGERPLQVFTSLREARTWLDEVSRIELKR